MILAGSCATNSGSTDSRVQEQRLVWSGGAGRLEDTGLEIEAMDVSPGGLHQRIQLIEDSLHGGIDVHVLAGVDGDHLIEELDQLGTNQLLDVLQPGNQHRELSLGDLIRL